MKRKLFTPMAIAAVVALGILFNRFDPWRAEEARIAGEQAQAEVSAAEDQAGKAAMTQQIAQRNAEAAERFLSENAQKEGVVVTESGLQYRKIKEGTGPSPTETEFVKVHYEGRLVDGTVFDSSVARNQPASFSLGQVIPGWQEALPMMKVGGKWELVVPPKLAYGDRSVPPYIMPNSTLVFEVELLEIIREPAR